MQEIDWLNTISLWDKYLALLYNGNGGNSHEIFNLKWKKNKSGNAIKNICEISFCKSNGLMYSKEQNSERRRFKF